MVIQWNPLNSWLRKCIWQVLYIMVNIIFLVNIFLLQSWNFDRWIKRTPSPFHKSHKFPNGLVVFDTWTRYLKSNTWYQFLTLHPIPSHKFKTKVLSVKFQSSSISITPEILPIMWIWGHLAYFSNLSSSTLVSGFVSTLYILLEFGPKRLIFRIWTLHIFRIYAHLTYIPQMKDQLNNYGFKSIFTGCGPI